MSKLYKPLVYITVAHVIDHLIQSSNRSNIFQLGSFDFYKFIAWFLIPLSLSYKNNFKEYLKKPRRSDYFITMAMIVVGVFAILIIPYIESLNSYYHSFTFQSDQQKFNYMKGQVIWTFSWLIGWEYIHRYYIITKTYPILKNKLLWIIPLLEGFYHYNKPPIEFISVFIFSFILTLWTIKRKNILLPFIIHLTIEIILIFSQVM